MIPLVVACAVLFTWAVIATAVAVAQSQLAAAFKLDADEAKDRASASSLSEYRAHRPVAMPEPEPELRGYWTTDATGLVREWVAE